ncbi:hypothetical protein LIER_41580 [Lithospermum erythrorhizon]|uniref:Uncharacterized protein n=1 Tax=Lithospermum erythrorhizon TaxID=34254 RepID=A0AAV3RBI5_LITER
MIILRASIGIRRGFERDTMVEINGKTMIVGQLTVEGKGEEDDLNGVQPGRTVSVEAEQWHVENTRKSKDTTLLGESSGTHRQGRGKKEHRSGGLLNSITQLSSQRRKMGALGKEGGSTTLTKIDKLMRMEVENIGTTLTMVEEKDRESSSAANERVEVADPNKPQSFQ